FIFIEQRINIGILFDVLKNSVCVYSFFLVFCSLFGFPCLYDCSGIKSDCHSMIEKIKTEYMMCNMLNYNGYGIIANLIYSNQNSVEVLIYLPE
ncbi:hypothetical protein CEN44_12685, partial [Fischerella muscicola CCMEE 5323]